MTSIVHRDATHLSLVVKGSELEATRKAADYGIPFTPVRITGHGETVGLVPLRYAAKVRKWFNDNGVATAPPGILLLWTETSVSPTSRVPR